MLSHPLAARRFGRNHSGTMKALTPARLAHAEQVSPLTCLAFPTSRPQPRYGPKRRFLSRLNALDGSCDPGFAMSEEARRAMPPKRVRYPAGCSFASGFSPPRLATTQLPSAKCDTTSHRVDFHLPDKRRNTDVLAPANAAAQFRRAAPCPATQLFPVGPASPTDRGREGFWPPLPPNRTGGFPAYGSPVADFHIGSVSLAWVREIRDRPRVA